MREPMQSADSERWCPRAIVFENVLMREDNLGKVFAAAWRINIEL